MKRVRTIGQGGFGIVSLYQTMDGNQYALKEMINLWDENHYERFRREVVLMKSLLHDNIVSILHSDISNNNPWYLMPYYHGGSLRDRLLDKRSRGECYSITGASGIILCLADALKYAHEKGFIHRDLKPENILFNNNEPKIADWGIGKFIHKKSKVLTYGGGLGSKSYCAPEQWDSGISDQKSDIYSLGIIYRELITGKVFGQVLDSRVNAIINKMTYPSPSDRYKSMDEVISDINELNIVSDEPLNDFWDGAIKIAAVAGILVVLANLLEKK